VCTAQRHKGGARRAEDSREAVHTKCQGEHSTGPSSEHSSKASLNFNAETYKGKPNSPWCTTSTIVPIGPMASTRSTPGSPVGSCSVSNWLSTKLGG
jgi:hypothetical protein